MHNEKRRPKRFENEEHVFQNVFWHTEYKDDLERCEIVPFNACRDSYSQYWWVGESRWRSKKQIEKMFNEFESKKATLFNLSVDNWKQSQW